MYPFFVVSQIFLGAVLPSSVCFHLIADAHLHIRRIQPKDTNDKNTNNLPTRKTNIFHVISLLFCRFLFFSHKIYFKAV